MKDAPILLTRTPYKAKDLTSHAQSSHLGPILSGYDNATEGIVEGGYIRVVQTCGASTTPRATTSCEPDGRRLDG